MAIKTGADAKDKVAPDKTKTTKVKKPSYQTVIKDTLKAAKGIATRAELMAATGADTRNLSVAVSILKNGKRTKEPMKIEYVRKTQTFYQLPLAAKALAAVQKELEAAKAPKKAAKTGKK
jgi:hypothetical protein